MQVELGTQVRTPDGQVVGPIARLILDTQTNDVRAIVIGAGGRLRHSVEVQLASIASASDGELRLTLGPDEIDALPTFVEDDYQGRSVTGAAPTVGSAAGEALWPTGYAPPPPAATRATPTAADTTELREAAVATDRDVANAVIGAGSLVQGDDGQPVGEVGGLTFDEGTGQVTSIVLRGGAPGGVVELPASLIAGVDDNLIRLAVPAAEVPGHAG